EPHRESAPPRSRVQRSAPPPDDGSGDARRPPGARRESDARSVHGGERERRARAGAPARGNAGPRAPRLTRGASAAPLAHGRVRARGAPDGAIAARLRPGARSPEPLPRSTSTALRGARARPAPVPEALVRSPVGPLAHRAAGAVARLRAARDGEARRHGHGGARRAPVRSLRFVVPVTGRPRTRARIARIAPDLRTRDRVPSAARATAWRAAGPPPTERKRTGSRSCPRLPRARAWGRRCARARDPANGRARPRRRAPRVAARRSGAPSARARAP